jgi:hypothetical protein
LLRVLGRFVVSLSAIAIVVAYLLIRAILIVVVLSISGVDRKRE